MRRLGVFGVNNPTKMGRTIQPSDFSIAGLYGMFSRKYDRTFRLQSIQDAQVILGRNENPNWYGWDALNGFFSNLLGQNGSIEVASYHEGAVQANYLFDTVLNFSSAYYGESSFGLSGNRSGFSLAYRPIFATEVLSVDGTNFVLESIAGVKVGDVLVQGTVYARVLSIDESTNTIVSADLAVGAAEVQGYRIVTYIKAITGAVTEVSTMDVTMNPNNRYISDVFTENEYLAVTVVDDIPLEGIAETGIQWLEGGLDGTRPTNYDNIWTMMDNVPIRMVSAVETTNPEHQMELEAYCNNREDNPIVFITGQMEINNKNTLITRGQNMQRSNEVDAIYVHNWLAITNPFGVQNRVVPSGGHLMGLWIRSIGLNGIHSLPARQDTPLMGVQDVVGFQALGDLDRTDLAEAGVNVIQNSGRGIVLRNMFTLSVSPEFRFSNGLIMRNFIKASAIEALIPTENATDAMDGVEQSRMAIIQFMLGLWNRGSNGNVPMGITFGRFLRDDGSFSTTSDAYEVIADVTNNPPSSIARGERNIDIYFMFPSPAGSIRVGVGLIFNA